MDFCHLGNEQMGCLMYLARLETRHFDFWAFDSSEDGAVEQLRLAWLQHRKKSGAVLTWDWLKDDVCTMFIRSGDTFVNRELWLSCDTPNAYPPLSECGECEGVFEGDTCPCEKEII
jgi:hypothetical protein